MPRPPVKRSRLNQANQASKRVPTYQTENTGSSPAAQRRKLQDQLREKHIGSVPTNSDDSDQLVTNATNLRNRRGVPRQEIYASGGVAHDDEVAAHLPLSRKRSPISSGRRLDVGTKRIVNTPTAAATSQRISTNADTRTSAVRPTTANTFRMRSQGSPTAETSALGTIKMRKRQPSILQLIDGPDSSTLNEDLDDFLPHDESTPPPSTRKRKLSSQHVTSTSTQDIQPLEQVEVARLEAQNADRQQPSLPDMPSSLTPSPEIPTLQVVDQDIMAPPRSSSTSISPFRTRTLSPVKTKGRMPKCKRAKPLTTSALQSLMPGRRCDRPHRERVVNSTNTFDIPEDSSTGQDESHSDRIEEISAAEASPSHIASPRPSQKRNQTNRPMVKLRKNRKALTHSGAGVTREEEVEKRGGGRNARTTRHGSRAAAASRPSHRSKTRELSTLSPSTSPRHTHTRPGHSPTLPPLPSSSIAAKSSRQRKRSTAKLPTIPPRKSHVYRGGGSTRYRGYENEDKENKLSDSSGNSFVDDDQGSLRPSRQQSHTLELTPDRERERLARKFQEVDAWEMEFEDVSFVEE